MSPRKEFLFEILVKILSRLPQLPFCFNFRRGPSCHPLSHDFKILRKKNLASKPSTKDWWILCVFYNTWFIYELLGLDLDGFKEIRLIFKKSYNICHKSKLQNFKNVSTNREYFFNSCLSFSLWFETISAIFHPKGKVTVLINARLISRGSQTEVQNLKIGTKNLKIGSRFSNVFWLQI